VLLPLAGVSVVKHVLHRALSMKRATVVCLATSDLPSDDPVADSARDFGVHTTRGSESDVLARYLQAAQEIEADLVVRITSDCPLIDPVVCDSLIEFLTLRRLEFASVNHANNWPHGLDCEVFTRELLEQCARSSMAAEEREHVTPWMYGAGHGKAGAMRGSDAAALNYRWVVDYPQDYDYLSRLFEYLPRFPALIGWEEVRRIADAHPELDALNAKWRVDPRNTGG